MLAGFGVSVRHRGLLQTTRRHEEVPKLTHMAGPTTPSSPHRGKQLFGISGGILAPASTLQAARRGGCRRLVELRNWWEPSVGFLAAGRVGTCLASAGGGSGWATCSPPSQRRSSSSKLLRGALTPPSNPHTTRQPYVTSMTHICRKSPNWPQPH